MSPHGIVSDGNLKIFIFFCTCPLQLSEPPNYSCYKNKLKWEQMGKTGNREPKVSVQVWKYADLQQQGALLFSYWTRLTGCQRTRMRSPVTYYFDSTHYCPTHSICVRNSESRGPSSLLYPDNRHTHTHRPAPSGNGCVGLNMLACDFLSAASVA